MLIKALHSLYRIFISPIFPPCCRFYPTCSGYAAQAFQRHGILKGLVLTIIRLCKCHPWGPHGHDPVPERFAFADLLRYKRLKQSSEK